jgi:hypothetical protein
VSAIVLGDKISNTEEEIQEEIAAEVLMHQPICMDM